MQLAARRVLAPLVQVRVLAAQPIFSVCEFEAFPPLESALSCPVATSKSVALRHSNQAPVDVSHDSCTREVMDEKQRVVAWSLLVAAIGFVLPLALNHLLNVFWLHRLHKLLAYVTAFVAFSVFIIAANYRARRSSASKGH